jgi:hypothetical protein
LRPGKVGAGEAPARHVAGDAPDRDSQPVLLRPRADSARAHNRGPLIRSPDYPLDHERTRSPASTSPPSAPPSGPTSPGVRSFEGPRRSSRRRLRRS